MCGIFGVAFAREGEAIHADAALASIAHRGPDDRGIWRAPERQGRVVLGHVRLSILDLTSAGHQPMLSSDGQIALVFNGEIYNHHAIRRELEALGVTFRSRTDTEVIVEGYRQWGEGIVDRLDGMFALAIWDANNRRVVFARDRAGKKPLFYAERRGALWFASEAKALFAAGLELEVDVRSLPFMLALGYTPAPHTMYRGVKQLPPASILVMDQGGTPRVREYWRVPLAEPSRLLGASPVSEAETTARVRTLTREAVERRLEADVPLGAFLSGGVDSTIVVGLMARAMGGARVKTFSIGFAADPRFDETRYARIAARAFGTDHTEFTLEPSSFDVVEKLVASHDGPFGDSSAVPMSVVSMLTRQQVTVALSGDGGDEIFCGYPRFVAAEAAERVPFAIRRGLSALAEALPRVGTDRSAVARVRRLLNAASLPLADRIFAWTSYFNTTLGDVLRDDIREGADVREGLDLDAPRRWHAAMMDRNSKGTVLARILAHNYEVYLAYDLLQKADRTSMLHSLEVRSPFLDTALVEYASRLPDRFKRRGRTTKWVLRRAFQDLLPSEIMTRAKMGFGVPLATWFRGDLKGYLRDRFAPGSEIYDYLERPFVERMLAEHFSGAVDHGGQIWLLLTLQIWLRSLAERRPTSVHERGAPALAI